LDAVQRPAHEHERQLNGQPLSRPVLSFVVPNPKHSSAAALDPQFTGRPYRSRRDSTMTARPRIGWISEDREASRLAERRLQHAPDLERLKHASLLLSCARPRHRRLAHPRNRPSSTHASSREQEFPVPVSYERRKGVLAQRVLATSDGTTSSRWSAGSPARIDLAGCSQSIHRRLGLSEEALRAPSSRSADIPFAMFVSLNVPASVDSR